MKLSDVRRVRSTHDLDEINRLLADGWIILAVCVYDRSEPGLAPREVTTITLGTDTSRDPDRVEPRG